MFSHMFTKRRALIAAGVIGAVAVGALAFAFWTTSGSGSGSATAGTDAGVTVSGDPANGIYPGGSVPVTTTVTNSSSTQSQHVAEPARGDLDRLGARYRWLLGELVHVQG